MKPSAVRNVPNSMTSRGPNLSMNQPTNGEIAPDSVRWRDIAPAVSARLQPNCSMMGSKNAPKPCQNVPDV